MDNVAVGEGLSGVTDITSWFEGLDLIEGTACSQGMVCIRAFGL